ncbi:MAG: peptide chain release factor N(5)-glutamine methyltransferase [Nitrospiraceae bacterium]|nr:MAG: peptide chain release factor N(5)-glutamine methyltransferase [Nitrospiraceae bacterium]
MKALDQLHDISRILASHDIDSPEKEAEIILRSAIDIGLADIYRDDPELNPDQIQTIEQTVSRRINREPLQYIIGHVDFMGLKLLVGKGVLIPRPETELMAEIAMKRVKGQGASRFVPNSIPRGKGTDSPLRILDLCTGSGCLALALAKEFPDAEVYGVDISDVALSYAKKNAELNNIGNVTFLRGNLFDPFTELLTLDSKLYVFDLIISNPPYIKTADVRDLQPEIRDWEPLNALDGGVNGLDYYREIIPAARQFLKPDGILMFELGINCADDVKEMLRTSGYSDIELIKDYAGIERIAVGEWGGH